MGLGVSAFSRLKDKIIDHHNLRGESDLSKILPPPKPGPTDMAAKKEFTEKQKRAIEKARELYESGQSIIGSFYVAAQQE